MSFQDPYEIRDAILQKPEAERTTAEKHIVDVICLLIDIESGGWLYNISPAAGEGRTWTRLRQVADSAAAIGATNMAGLLKQVISIVESADVQQPVGIWDDFLGRADPERRLRAIEPAIVNEVSTTQNLLRLYTAQHFVA